MTVGGTEEKGTMLTASSWGTQESGARALQWGVRSGRSDTRKPPSTATNEEGSLGCHDARPRQ